MRKYIIGLLLGAVVVLLSGCWDQQLLKNERNVSIGGMDYGGNGLLRATVSIRDITVTEAGNVDTSEVHSVLARSTQHARELINEEVSGDYSSSKLRVLLFGEDMVRNHDILPYLDAYYRDSKSQLNCRVAVTKGKAQNLIELQKIGTKTIGLHIDELLKSMEFTASIPNVNVQTLHPLDRGFDFSLPYIVNHNGIPNVYGIAMFSGTKMTGILNSDESKLYLLLSGNSNKNQRMTLKTVDKHKAKSYNYVTVDVKHLKRQFKVTVSDDNQVKVKLRMDLRVTVIEDPSNHLYKASVKHELAQHLSEELTDNAREIIAKMQAANHDGFGVARRLMSFYPKVWKQVDWDKEYPRIPFDTTISLQIVNTGITE